MLPALLLVGALAAYGWFLESHRLPWQDLGWRPVCWRHRQPRAAVRLALLFGASAVAGLALLGRLDAVLHMPPEFAPAQALAASLTGIDAGTDFPLGLMAGAMVAGGAIGAGVARLRKGRALTLGRIDAVLPRDARELGWSVLLSVDAGVTEELFFRLLLPLLLALVFGSAVAGFAVAAILFALAHRYQGWLGVAATGVVALLLTAAYLLSGRLWVAIALHIALDLNGLVLRPLLTGTLRR